MKKWTTIILVIVLVLVLAGAGTMYNKLKDQVETDPLMTAPPATQDSLPPEPQTEATQAVPETTTEETEPPRQPAPDFTVYDGEGNAHLLSDFQGKPVVLNFWATWCGYCVMEMPEFQTAFDNYGEDIHFLMVNVTDGAQETEEKAKDFIAEKGFSFPVYYDLDLSAAYAYGVNAMPVTYFIDAEGNLTAWGQGAMNLQTLEKGIAMLME